jgi:hypothetical protein
MNVNFRTADVNGIKIFYREAGRPNAPAFPRNSNFLSVINLRPQIFFGFICHESAL